MSTFKEALALMEGKLDPKKTPGLNAVYQFDITGDDGGKFFVAFKDGVGVITGGDADTSNITITMSTDTFAKVMAGQLNPNMAFMTGKLKIKGDMQLALKLQAILG